MSISKELYSEIVNEAIRLKKINPSKDASSIAEQVIEDYRFKLKGLSENRKHELSFQVVYSIVNAFR